MKPERQKYSAIGLTFSLDTFELISPALGDKKFGVTCEGSRTTGYEIYVISEYAEEAVELIKSSQELQDSRIEIYDRIRDFDDGTKYDRLVDHFEGEDPDRPTITGVRFEV